MHEVGEQDGGGKIAQTPKAAKGFRPVLPCAYVRLPSRLVTPPFGELLRPSHHLTQAVCISGGRDGRKVWSAFSSCMAISAQIPVTVSVSAGGKRGWVVL